MVNKILILNVNIICSRVVERMISNTIEHLLELLLMHYLHKCIVAS